MKIYFEKFGEGRSSCYLTPWKIYQVCGVLGGCVQIKDDNGVERNVYLDYDFHVFSSWKILPEETKTQSDSDIIESLESERDALANSVESVNELLDSLSVPKEETLVERVKLAVNEQRDKRNGVRKVHRSGRAVRSGCSINVEMVTESGETVLIYDVVRMSVLSLPVCPAASNKEGE